MPDINTHKKVYTTRCICPVCKGKKTIEHKIQAGDRMGFIDFVPCKFCLGHGILERKVTIELFTI